MPASKEAKVMPSLGPRSLTVPHEMSTLAIAREPIEGAPIWDEIEELRAHDSALSAPDLENQRAEMSWVPDFSQFALKNRTQGSQSFANFFERYVWSEPSQKPIFRDLDFGLEFEINQHNGSAIHAGIRYATCVPGIKEHFRAVNYGFSWGAIAPYGWYAGPGAYGDVNDWFDPCSQQSMAIGIREPGYVNSSPFGDAELILWIDAVRGTLATENKVSGVIQAVEGLSCQAPPWNGTINTDCMGLNGGVVYNDVGPTYYTTLNASRDFWAPNLCWVTYRQKQLMPNGVEDYVWRDSCALMGFPDN